MKTIRPEYPRPDYVRASYQNLNGAWKFAYDDEDQGIAQAWQKGHEYPMEIIVPFAYQSKCSGIEDKACHDILWYEKDFAISDEVGEDMEVILHFGAVDYIADVFINGQFAGRHEGGDSPFNINITSHIVDHKESQTVCLRVYDPCEDETIPRGKQFWEPEPASIWYTPTSGIWQSVWLEVVNKRRIDRAHFISHFDEGKEEVKLYLNGNCKGCTAKVRISFEDELITEMTTLCNTKELSLTADLIQNHIFRTNFHNDGRSWTPENPNLFDVELYLLDENGVELDHVTSYFGFRKIHCENHMVYLNNKPYYQRLVLDQGYWPEGLLTAPSDEALKYDIEAAKALGFNGCRKHQKAEDPRFLYWADKLGYLVWGECASIPTFGEDQVRREMHLWSEIVERDFNHPSIVCWVPINESWGVPEIHNNRQQQHYSQACYHFLHSIDPTRLVISNDGWELTETDICAIHNYEHGPNPESAKAQEFPHMFESREEMLHHPCGRWDVYAKGFEDKGAPIILTEFGGIAYKISSAEDEKQERILSIEESQQEDQASKDWGYSNAGDEAQYVSEYRRVLETVLASPVMCGFCYTQLTDVEQEINGLMTYDRKFKCDPAVIKEINEGFRRYRSK